MNSNLFYGFRGNILFPDKLTIFNIGLQNNSDSKNKIFREYFQMIEEKKKLESQYQSRLYSLSISKKKTVQ